MIQKSLMQIILNLIPFDFRNRIRYLPILKQLQSWVMRYYLDGKEFNAVISGGPAKGLAISVSLPQDKQMWIGTWELDFAKSLADTIKPEWVCYDIGGYKGYYSGIMALKGAKQVYVFEPMPSNAEKIKKLINLNRGLPILLKEYAISDTSGLGVFKLMPEETMGKLKESSFQRDEKYLTKVNVTCRSLDDLIRSGLPAPDFIKIDVEGTEEFVLKGATELLRRKKPFMMIEVHSPSIGIRCMQILRQHYDHISVLETGLPPEHGTPEICHYLVHN